VGRGQRRGNDLAQAIEDRADVPVLVAALASVPAVFLTMTSGVWAVIGTVLNTASGITLIGESVLLLLVSGERLRWIREHRGELVLAIATLPTVVLFVGPVQVFRLIIFLSAMRLLRVRRILAAADVISRRAELPRHHRTLVLAAVTTVAVVFVAVVLLDPHSVSHRIADWVAQHVGLAPPVVTVLLVVLIVLGAWVLERSYELIAHLVRRLVRRREKEAVPVEQ
jgi:CsoR family transcriptional regulator, copper-sensing transcriptional repressor